MNVLRPFRSDGRLGIPWSTYLNSVAVRGDEVSTKEGTRKQSSTLLISAWIKRDWEPLQAPSRTFKSPRAKDGGVRGGLLAGPRDRGHQFTGSRSDGRDRRGFAWLRSGALTRSPPRLRTGRAVAEIRATRTHTARRAMERDAFRVFHTSLCRPRRHGRFGTCMRSRGSRKSTRLLGTHADKNGSSEIRIVTKAADDCDTFFPRQTFRPSGF